uniref:Uncharacterized protein n=1 Tax=Ditylenchus dipsaci TaxID=166011 RepID=A0A915D385_9BILA
MFLLLLMIFPRGLRMSEAVQAQTLGLQQNSQHQKPYVIIYAVDPTDKIRLAALSAASAILIGYSICLKISKPSDARVYLIKVLVPMSMYYAAVGVHEILVDKTRTFQFVVASRGLLILL